MASRCEFLSQALFEFRCIHCWNVFGLQMLYFGGSSFGWNAVSADFTDPKSPNWDPAVEVLLYYSDFYGSAAFEGGTYNLPAAWMRKNVLMCACQRSTAAFGCRNFLDRPVAGGSYRTSIHPCADNCTAEDREDQERADCTPAGTIADKMILKNRAWLVTHLNKMTGMSMKLPAGSMPNMSTAKPHTDWPTPACGTKDLFCDGFDTTEEDDFAHGLWQWQRNQSFFNAPQPWNITYISEWAGCARPCSTGSHSDNNVIKYGEAESGNGYAVVVPFANGWNDVHVSAILTKPVMSVQGATLTYYVRGCTNCTDPPGPRAIAPQEEPRLRASPACKAAEAKLCPGLAHKGPDCHACCINNTAALTAAGCNVTGDPPPDVSSFCMPSGTKYPQGAFIVEYLVLDQDEEETPSSNATYRIASSSSSRRRTEEGPAVPAWTTLSTGTLKGGALSPWKQESWSLPRGKVQVKFSCAGATNDGANYCAIDTVAIAAK